MRKMTALIFVMCFFGSMLNVEATGGQISSKKIKYCSEVPYGRHGDDYHWHKAQMKGDRWYPDGPNLGYSDPCPNASLESTNHIPSNSLAKNPSSNEKSQSDFLKIAQEEAKIIEQQKKAKIEADRKSKEEAERLKFEEEKIIQQVKTKQEEEKKEKLKLNNTKLHSVKAKGFQNLANNDIVYSDLDEDILIKTVNEKATYKLYEVSTILPFTRGLVQVNVVSENRNHEESHTIDVFKVGSQIELEQQELFLVYEDKKYPFENKKFSIPNNELIGFSGISPVLEINDITVLRFTSDIDEVITKKKDVMISFTLGDDSFILPVEKHEDISKLILPYGAAAIGTVGAVAIYSKNKKSKKSVK